MNSNDVWHEPGAEGNLGDETIIRLIKSDGRVESRLADVAGLVLQAQPPWPRAGTWLDRIHASGDVLELELIHREAGIRLRLRKQKDGYHALPLNEREALAEDAIRRIRAHLPVLPEHYELRVIAR